MNGIVLIIFCVSILGAAQAGMPTELRELLRLGGKHYDEIALGGSQEEIIEGDIQSIEAAEKYLGDGSIDSYMAAPITNVECYIEMQVTKRLPGRCTRLAGNIPACKAEKYISSNFNECS